MTYPRRGQRRTMQARVVAVTDIADRMRQIELTGPDFARLRCRPGAHLVVRLPAARRVYSVWSLEPARATLTLRVAMHAGDAPGCVWARTAHEGDRITLEEPRSKITLDPAARFHLFVGDETGAVPLLAMRAALAPQAPSYGLFEATDTAGEVPDKDRRTDGTTWVHRGRKSAVASRVLLDAVREMSLPQGHGVAYVAGESATTRLLQRHLVEQRGWPRRAVLVQQQWAPGRPGFGAGDD